MGVNESGTDNAERGPEDQSLEARITRRCGTQRLHQRLLQEVPGYAARRAAIENQVARTARSPQYAGRIGCTRIPVVVHVVYKTPDQNISQAQVGSQIKVLNEDFRAGNADIVSVPAAFKSLVGDCRLQFSLATIDPAGNPTTGVTRSQTAVDAFADLDDAVKFTASGGIDAWPSGRYFNIWVCELAGGLLGYAQFPGGPPSTAGIVVTHSAFGTNGTATAPFDRGRTAVHECGHSLVVGIFGATMTMGVRGAISWTTLRIRAVPTSECQLSPM
ncbi:hypothetical protein [Kocuria sabuli]|uniref:hypothetical protein n=1 Tax=Kocuria sabuli TaxID=3071448 RepID=UPI0034D7B190